MQLGGLRISLNPTREGSVPDWVDDTFVEQHEGTGIHTTHRFYDSWIVNNNVGSTGPNLSVRGGPVRILPTTSFTGHRDITSSCAATDCSRSSATSARASGARRSSPHDAGLAGLDSSQVQIVANNITNGGEQSGRFPGDRHLLRSAEHRASGFAVTGNFFACTDDDAG